MLQYVQKPYAGIFYRLSKYDNPNPLRNIEVYDPFVTGLANFDPIAITRGTVAISLVSRTTFYEGVSDQSYLSGDEPPVKLWHSHDDAPEYKTTVFVVDLEKNIITKREFQTIPEMVRFIRDMNDDSRVNIVLGHDVTYGQYHEMFTQIYSRTRFYENRAGEICVDGATVRYWVESLGDPDKTKDVEEGLAAFTISGETGGTGFREGIHYRLVDDTREVKIAMMSYGETVIIPIALKELMQLVADIRKDRPMTNVRNVTGEIMSIRTMAIDGIRLLSSAESEANETKVPEKERCDMCEGTGMGFLEECYQCDGTGMANVKK